MSQNNKINPESNPNDSFWKAFFHDKINMIVLSFVTAGFLILPPIQIYFETQFNTEDGRYAVLYCFITWVTTMLGLLGYGYYKWLRKR